VYHVLQSSEHVNSPSVISNSCKGDRSLHRMLPLSPTVSSFQVMAKGKSSSSSTGVALHGRQEVAIGETTRVKHPPSHDEEPPSSREHEHVASPWAKKLKATIGAQNQHACSDSHRRQTQAPNSSDSDRCAHNLRVKAAINIAETSNRSDALMQR
jgi:hypothetical protein